MKDWDPLIIIILIFLFQQFIHLYRKLENRRGDVLKWGDEVEYIIVKLDRENKKAQVRKASLFY
jgi:hypothetical protein